MILLIVIIVFILTKIKIGAEFRTLENENFLKNEKRPEVLEKLKVARDFGDLSENSEYDAARDEQSKIAGRIAVIENILKNYELIGDETNNLGKWVKIEFLDLEDEDEPAVEVYKIVGTLEADPLKQLISDESPLGHAIVNKKEG